MKESNTLANIAAMKQLNSQILKDTRRQCTRESNTLANIAAIKQLQRIILKHTRRQCMKESDTLAKFVAIKQLGRKVWQNTCNLCIKEWRIPLAKIYTNIFYFQLFTMIIFTGDSRQSDSRHPTDNFYDTAAFASPPPPGHPPGELFFLRRGYLDVYNYLMDGIFLFI